MGLWEGSTGNASVATALLSDLVERGLDPEQGILFVIDGAKAIRDVFGEAPVQRCLRHKERDVLEHLPERERPAVKQRLHRAWQLDDHTRALDQLRRLAGELDRSYPGAAGMLEAEQQFRKIIGHHDLATLAAAIEHDNDARHHPVNAAPTQTKEDAIVAAT